MCPNQASLHSLVLMLLVLVLLVLVLLVPQVYKAVLRDTGEEVAVKVQRPGIEPVILRDLFIFRALGSLFNTLSRQVSSTCSRSMRRMGVLGGAMHQLLLAAIAYESSTLVLPCTTNVGSILQWLLLMMGVLTAHLVSDVQCAAVLCVVAASCCASADMLTAPGLQC